MLSAMLSLLSCIGCGQIEREPVGYDYPNVTPIWIVEDDPRTTIFQRNDLERDRKVGKIMVIPVYRDFMHEGVSNTLAIAHPFVYQQGADIEGRLSSLGQRENLCRLIFWVPGYFPNGMGRTPPWEPIINGQRMVVLQLQTCMRGEKSEIDSAMKGLLLSKDFTVEKTVSVKAPPPPYTPAKMSEEAYDISRLVRSTVFGGRYYNHESLESVFALWAFAPGTRITIHLSDSEKEMVAAFAANKVDPTTEPDSRNDGNDGSNPKQDHNAVIPVEQENTAKACSSEPLP